MKKYTFEFNEKETALIEMLINNGIKSGKDITLTAPDGSKSFMGKECSKLDDTFEEQYQKQLPKKSI